MQRDYVIENYIPWQDFRLGCVRVLHQRGMAEPKIHRHKNFHELVIVRSGSARHCVDGCEQLISAGSVFLVFPDQHHGFRELEDLEIYNLLFGRAIFRYFLPDLTSMEGFQLLFKSRNNYPRRCLTDGLKVPAQLFPELLAMLDEMVAYNQNPPPGAQTVLLSDFMKVARLLSCHVFWSSESPKLSHIQPLSGLLARLDREFRAEWPVPRMAASVNMSVPNFNREFKKLTGSSPGNYLLSLRLEKAAALLHLKELKVTNVAFDCGFGDLNYFSRAFKKRYGVSPSRA